MVIGILFICVGIINGKIEVGSFSHLTLEDDFAFQVPYRDADAFKDDSLEVFLRLEPIVDVTRHASVYLNCFLRTELKLGLGKC